MLHRIALWATLILVSGISTDAFSFERVAARMGYLELRSSYAMPLGSYTGSGGFPFIDQDGLPVTLDGTNLYKDGYSLGLDYGQIIGGKWILGVGFDYAGNMLKNPVVQPGYVPTLFPKKSSYNHYAIVIRSAYAPLDLGENGWSPSFGPSASFGLASFSEPGYDSQYQADFGLDLDFGLDVRIWRAPDSRSMVALSSINSWNFVATGDRVSHLQIGGGLKYFFKP